MMNKRSKGNRYEKLACQALEAKGFLTWRPPKSRWSYGRFTSDVFNCGDIIATKRKRFMVVAVAYGRPRPKTAGALKNLRRNCPRGVFLEYWVYRDSKRKKGWEIICY